MERAVYFDAWLKNQYCTHPSMPMRSLRMLEDLKDCRATSLVWAGLGGGSISLPFLHHEAFGPVDPRQRFYGYMNDAEFIRRCNENSIKLFSIVFEVQGWEFPARYDEAGGLQELNFTEAPNGYYGLREFSGKNHEGLFSKSFDDFYPNGIVNSAGEVVTNLLEECAARDYNGDMIHARWVEMPVEGAYCIQTCRNNPVWRDYLKKIIMLQIDAGVAGVQLDESELPITALRHGGCFCRDCVDGFTKYLRNLKHIGKLSLEYMNLNLECFNYKEFILEQGIDFPNGDQVPLFKEYWEYQVLSVKQYFTELTDFIRSYGKETQGEEVLVSGNFFNGMPVYYPIRDTVDVVTTEMECTLFRQPHWYRYISGFANGKDVIVAENPYGGIVPDLVEMLNRGKGYDLYRIFLLEATAYGCNMAMPYGGWMGNTMRDAFWPPQEISVEVGRFLEGHDRLIRRKSGATIAVLYSWPSCYWLESTKNSTGNVDEGDSGILFFTPSNLDDPTTTRLPFWEAIRELSDQQVVYDVITLGDGEFVEDDFGTKDLSGYNLLVLPECTVLTPLQKGRIQAFAEHGGRLLLFGKTAVDDPGFVEALAKLENVTFCANPPERVAAMAGFRDAFDQTDRPKERVWVNKPNLGIHTHKLEDGVAVHLISYAYDEIMDQCVTETGLRVTVPVSGGIAAVKFHTLTRSCELEWTINKTQYEITIPDFSVYGILEIRMGKE